MVTYTYHGDGSVTVSPSPGQTGGSGFGSEGTYGSEQAARSAVSSGTREGAKENEQLEAKRKALQSPTAQWASQEAYEQAYLSYLQGGGTPISQPAGVIPGSTPEERRTEAAAYQAGGAAPQVQQQIAAAIQTPILTGAMQRTQFDYTYGLEKTSGIPKEEWLTMTRRGMTPQVIPGEGYGWRSPEPTLGPMSSMFRPDMFTRSADAQLAATGKFMAGLDVDVSKTLNLKGYLGSVYSGYRESERMQRQLVTEQSVGKTVTEMPKLFTETKKGTELFVIGAGKGLAEKPVTTIGNVAIAFAVTKGMGALVSKAPVLARGVGVGRVARHISAANIAGAGMVGLYGADVGIRVSQSPRPMQTLGEITSTEIIPFGTGAYLGTKVKMGDILPKAKPDKTPKVITDKEPIVDLRKAYAKKAIETETWKDYESLMKANRWDIIDKKYPTPEPKPVKQIRTIDLSKDLVKLKPDFSIPAPRKTYPYGEFSKLTDRLVTPGEELIPFPKAKLPATTKQGKVTILKDLNKELRSKWQAEDIKLGKMAQKQGYFTSPEGQQVGTQQIQILKQVQKAVVVPKAIQRIRTVNLEKDLIGLTALAIPIFARKTKQIAVMPKSLQKQQIPKTTFKPIQVPKTIQVPKSISKTVQIPVMKPIQQMKPVEITISKQISKTMMRVPEMRLPLIPKFRLPGEAQILRGRGRKRKVSAYTIKNPFATLKDVIGDF